MGFLATKVTWSQKRTIIYAFVVSGLFFSPTLQRISIVCKIHESFELPRGPEWINISKEERDGGREARHARHARQAKQASSKAAFQPKVQKAPQVQLHFSYEHICTNSYEHRSKCNIGPHQLCSHGRVGKTISFYQGHKQKVNAYFRCYGFA